MNFTPVHRCLGVAFAGLILGLISGCATTAEPANGAKIIVDGDKYVTLDAPVGSHIKRRVKVSDLNEPGMSPTKTGVVTSETDTMIPPPTATEMRATMGMRGP